MQRKTAVDDLDFYPTQPWVTRALFEHVLNGRTIKSVWEPACGGGHMAEVIREYNVPNVYATDIFDYGYGQTYDFLNGPRLDLQVDWIITNPPYSNMRAEKFAIRAMTHPGVIGVAMLCRNNWLEGGGRYKRLFSKFPPSQVAILCDRVGFTKGSCEVGKSGMLPYSWFVWDLTDPGMNRISWVPPKTRDLLSREDDAHRFNRPLVERL